MSEAPAPGREPTLPAKIAAPPSRYVDLWLMVSEAEADWAAQLLCQLGSRGAVESPENGGQVRVLGSFPAETAAEARLALEAQVAASLASGLLEVEPRIGSAESLAIDWQQVMRHHHRPFRVRDVLVRPPWIEPSGGLEIVLEPGMAFGTGSHDTTRLCLEALAAEIDSRRVRRLFDVGTGSGILALVALRLDPTIEALACDVDPDAIESARAAAAANGLASRLELHVGRPSPSWGLFDLVVANLQWNVFLQEMPSIAAALAPHGVLLCSGLLLEQAGSMTELAGRFGLRLRGRSAGAEWCLLRFTHDAT
jgi:ribosomal protein L11 methyltransferase